MMIGLTQLGNSIATQLLRTVFTLYCIVAIAVTAAQIFAEYKHTESVVGTELAKVENMFASVLSTSVWNLDQEQITNTLQGIMAMPVVTGIMIYQEEQLLAAMGEVITLDNRIKQYSERGELVVDNRLTTTPPLAHTFTINYTFRKKERKVGTATVFANAEVVFDRVKIGIALLIINAIIKTIALWLIFYYVSKYMLVRPLKNLLAFIEKTEFDECSTAELDLQLIRENEFTSIEHAFKEMLEKLQNARQELVAANHSLEHKVAQRTADLSVAKEQAEQLNLDKINFMSRISHELNTPLSAIIAGAKVLAEHSEEWSEEDKYTSKHITVASAHLSMLVNDIICNLQMQNQDITIALESCDLHAIIQSSIAMLTPLANDKNVSIDYVPAKLRVLTNEGRLRQVLLNIISNAILYNHPNGKVEIFTSLQDDNRVSVTIEDTGVGMIDADLNRIFRPFERLEYAKENCIEGMGIGLTIAGELLKHLDAEYTVKSQLGKGTQFTIYLPTS